MLTVMQHMAFLWCVRIYIIYVLHHLAAVFLHRGERGFGMTMRKFGGRRTHAVRPQRHGQHHENHAYAIFNNAFHTVKSCACKDMIKTLFIVTDF